MIAFVEPTPSNHCRDMVLPATYSVGSISPTHPPVDPHNVHERLKIIILVPVTTLIIVSNLVVLFYLLCHKQFHKPAYLFVASLGIADLFVGCVSVATIVNANDAILELCLVRIGFVISACVASIYCMMWISIDRYIAIIYPLRYHLKMSGRRAGIIVVFIWTKSFMIGFTPLLGWNVGTYHHYCSVAYIVAPGFLVFLFATGFVIPMFVITVVYWQLFKKARFHLKRMLAVQLVMTTTNQSAQTSEGRSDLTGPTSRNWKSVRIAMILIGCFAVTWFPFIVTAFAQIVCGDAVCHLKDIIGSYLLLLGFTNSFLNPIIYAASNKEFKSMFYKSFCRCCKHRIRPFLQS